MKFLLAFSGAFLLGISVLHLFPEIYHSEIEHIGLFILSGFVLQLLLEIFSEGIEHGHIHKHSHHGPSFPLGVMISLCLHAFLEGMPIEGDLHYHEHAHVHTEGAGNASLFIGVVLHKLPVALALVSMLLANGLSKGRTFFWLMVFALMAPLGTIAGHFIADSGWLLPQDFFQYLTAIVVGMFLHIATTILFESGEGHRFNAIKLLTVLIGIALAWLSSVEFS